MPPRTEKLANDAIVEAWHIVHRTVGSRAGQAASASARELRARYEAVYHVPEISLRLALGAAIRAIAEELALAPGQTILRLVPIRIARSLQNAMRSDLRDLRNRAWAFGVVFHERNQEFVQVSQALFGNWIAMQLGLDHKADENGDLVWALGRAAVMNGVAITEEATTRVIGPTAD